MYYTGTQEQCEAYNTEVTLRENYQSSTTRWAEVVEHPNGTDFAILMKGSGDEESEMTEVSELSADWFPNELGE